MPQNVKEISSGEIFDVGALAMNVIKVMSKSILVVTKGSIEPVDHVDEVMLWHFHHYEISHEFETGRSPERINKDFLNLLDNNFGCNRSLQKGNN